MSVMQYWEFLDFSSKPLYGKLYELLGKVDLFMKIALQFALILFIWQIGEWISTTFNSIIPGPIFGMLLLLVLLETKLIKEDYIKLAGDLFLKVLPFFFIPSGVAILAYTDLIKDIWISMVVILVLSMATVMIVAGKTTQYLINKRGKNNDNNS